MALNARLFSYLSDKIGIAIFHLGLVAYFVLAAFAQTRHIPNDLLARLSQHIVYYA